MLETDDGFLRLAAFRHALDEQWAATCELGRASSGIGHRPPVVVTNVMVGISYEPLRRLSPLLDLYEVDVFHERVWPEPDPEADKKAVDGLKISTDQDIERAAERLAAVILERAIPFAEQHAELEALLARFSRIETDGARLTCAALEASGSGRWTAAELDPDARPYLDRVYEVTPHVFGLAALTAWIRQTEATPNAGGVIEVALGETPVGKISTSDAADYVPVLADAAARCEHPCLEAHLTLRNDEYLLEIARPPSIAA